MRYHTNQSRKVVFYRPPQFTTDGYGVETTTIATSGAEMVIPDLPALIRPSITADYTLQRSGHNIVGAARVYTPNLATIKGFDNFNQSNDPQFNEIEGWDRLIDVNRYIYTVPTNATTAWTSGTTADVTFTSDGQTLTATLGTDYEGDFYYTTGATNTLEADRIRFQIKASGASNIALINCKSMNGGTQNGNYAITYTPASLSIPTGSWLTVDLPFVTGSVTSGSSIYLDGTRHAVTITTGSSFDYEADFRDFVFNVSGAASGNKVMVRDIKYYKSIRWMVQAVRDYNDDYVIYECVRIKGKSDKNRRAR
jgi:hypothetical protein